MDPWLLSLLLSYDKLPERAGILWDLMKAKREEIILEKSRKNRDMVLSVLYDELSTYELEFRDILIKVEIAKKTHGIDRRSKISSI